MDNELYHSGRKGMRWGRRLYQNEDGSLTPLGRIHYGIGAARSGGVYDSSNTFSKRAKRFGKFGTELAKAKTHQYTSTGLYKARRAKNEFARKLRGKEANKQIARSNRRIQWDYKISRAQASGIIDLVAKSTYKSVFSSSDARFKSRISAGKKYVELTKRYVPRGAINKIGWDNIDNTLPEFSIGRKSLAGITRVKLR